ncbi:hypothetical protein AN958_04736 [Leucoagaricus sp. SymC.cos]|nr:hypothetical protein AN958_04736 [Leucoagaricus sp. SymC.cos]
MPRKAAAAGEDGAQTEQSAPRRSTRIASQPKVEGTKPASKSRVSKKRTADDANTAGASEEGSGEKGKAKKVKASTDAGDAEGYAEAGASGDTPQLASIDIGDNLPSLILKNEKGEDLQVADITNEKGAVLFLVPKADTPGCTAQACGFRDIFSDFSQFGYEILAQKELPYSLISDPKRILISALGAGEGGKTKRSHFIFEKGGKLVDKKIPVKPVDSPKFALEFIKGATTSTST